MNGVFLRNFRLMCGLSAYEMGKQFGVSHTTWARYERTGRLPAKYQKTIDELLAYKDKLLGSSECEWRDVDYEPSLFKSYLHWCVYRAVGWSFVILANKASYRNG